MPSFLTAATAFAALSLLTLPAFADAATYRGTLGKADIVLELSSPAEAPEGKVVGRYFYHNKGIDIPLDAVGATNGALDLVEEKPCTEATCPMGDDNTPSGPAPVGAKWHLVGNTDGSKLTGTWSAGAKSLPLSLERAGTRPLPGDFDHTTLSLEDIVASKLTFSVDTPTPFSIETSPYDYIKMHEAPVAPGEATEWPNGSFQFVSDTRTKFAYPSVTDLKGADVAAIDSALEQRRWQMSTDALYCEAQAYQGFGWSSLIAYSIGTLGGYPDETVKVHYLSPTVMTLEESGSTFCGGAHPYNHDEYTNLDVRTGKKLDLSLVFNAWVPTPYNDTTPKDLATARAKPDDYSWGPNEKLIAFVKAHLPKDGGVEANTDPSSDCGQENLIDTNLGIGFVEGDKVRFVIDGLENAVEACGGTLYEMPLAELKDFLTPEAADYFPSLKDK